MAINGSVGPSAEGTALPGTVDVHSHAMPLPLLERLAERGLADLAGVPDGIVRLDPRVSGVGPLAPLPLARSQYDVDVRLAEMDEVGVERHAVSLPPFLFCSTADDEAFATGIVGAANDELAVYVADDPGRLIALGSVPLGWRGAADEARRCLDDPVNDELWALLSERETFVFLHPSGVPDPHRQADFWLPQLVGYPMETALAVARLVFGRVLERHPLNLCLAHGGGCLPALRGRLDMGWDRKEVAHTTTVPPSAFTDRLYYDTAVFSGVLLRRLVEDVGTDHVLLGTDHPFELGDRAPLDTVRALGLDADATRAILGGNAESLLGLSVSRR